MALNLESGQTIDRAVNREMSGDHNGAMDALGEGLHTTQDRTAHDVQNAGWWKHIKDNPDDPTKHPAEYNQAQEDSNSYLNRYTEALEKALIKRIEEEKKSKK